MDNDQVVDFLSAVTAYDARITGEANVHAWTEAATRGRWTLDEALDALHEHYAATTDYLMPGHITQRVKTARQAAGGRVEGPPMALPSRPRTSELDQVWAEHIGKPCPRCAAPAGERCRGVNGREAKIPHLPRTTGRDAMFRQVDDPPSAAPVAPCECHEVHRDQRRSCGHPYVRVLPPPVAQDRAGALEILDNPGGYTGAEYQRATETVRGGRRW